MLIYDLEDKFQNSPQFFGNALLIIKKRYAGMSGKNLNQQLEEDDQCFERGKKVALDLIDFEEDMSELQYTLNEYDLKCREKVLLRDAYILVKDFLEEQKVG